MAETKGRQCVHPTPCRAPSAAPAMQNLPAKRRRPRDARAYIRPLVKQQVLRLPRKSYRQSGGDQGTPGRTSDPLQSSKCCACHAKGILAERRRPRDARRTSDPLQSSKCCACHAKAAETKGRQGVHPTPCRAPSAAPATQKAAENKGRQGVHPTPCTAPSAVPATQKLPAERRRPRDARAYIRPLAEQQVLRLPRKSHRRPRDARAYIRPLAEQQVLRLPRKSYRQSGGDQGTLGVHPTPCRAASAAPATQKAAETKGRQGVHPTPVRVASAAPATQKTAETKGRQGVHLTPCRAPSAALAMQKPPAERRRPGRQGVHPTPCRAPSAAPATQKLPAERRRPRDARAYIRPLAEQQVLRLPRKSYRQSGGDQGTPGSTSDPLQSTKCCACHAKPTGKAAETKGRQGVHPTPCRAASAAPATQKLPAERRRPRDAKSYIRPLAEQQVLRLPRKKQRRPRDARAYIRPLAEQQVLRLPRKSYRQSGGDQGTPGRTSDPLQSSKCCACHAKSTGDQGTPGRTSDPLQSTKCRACHAKECE